MPGKPFFSVYDLRSLTPDDLDEMWLALRDRLIVLRTMVGDTRDVSEDLARRRNRVTTLIARIDRVRRDPDCVKRGNEARAAFRSEMAALNRPPPSPPPVDVGSEAGEEDDEDED